MILIWSCFCLIIVCTFLQLAGALVAGKANAINYNFTKNKIDGQWLTSHVYGVSPNSGSIYLFVQNNDIWSEAHEQYHVKNVGRDWVHTYARMGNFAKWIQAVASANLQPGQRVTLNPEQKAYYNQLVVTNYGTTKAYVQCYMGSYTIERSSPSGWNFELDMNNLMKKLSTFASDYIPEVGSIISNLIDFLWPSTSVDVWEEVKNKVTVLIEGSISDLVERTLNNKIRMYRKRLEAISMAQEMGVDKERIKLHYLNIAQDMIGLEEEFRFPKESSNAYQKINYATLPLFSLVVSMKVIFYKCGLDNPDALGLDDKAIKELKVYAFGTLHPEKGVILKHFREILNYQIESTYNNEDPDNMFNNMANIMTYIAFNGEQYWPVWNDMINGSPAKGRPHNPVLYYPSYVGLPTADLFALAAQLPTMGNLTPKMKNGKRARIVKIVVNTSAISKAVCGIEVHYNDKTVVKTGKREGEGKRDEFNIGNDYIVKLDVWGNFPSGAIKGLDIYTDRNITYKSGTTADKVFTFEMDKHHVAGIHFSNDWSYYTAETRNVAASFQPDSIYHD